MFKSARRITVTAVILTFAAAASIHAQTQTQSGSSTVANPASQAQKIPDDLWQLLGDWEEGSKRIQKIHGRHVCRAYDFVFE